MYIISLITGLGISLLFKGKDSPAHLRLAKDSAVLELECYGDQLIPVDKHSWAVNGEEQSFGTNSLSFTSDSPGITITRRGSKLIIPMPEYHANVSCAVGKESKTVYVRGKGKK